MIEFILFFISFLSLFFARQVSVFFSMVTFPLFIVLVNERERKFRAFLLFLIYSLLHLGLSVLGVLELKLGIEFGGGIRIPLLFDRPLSSYEMESAIKTIKERLARFGLEEIKVYSVGDSQVFVELPYTDEKAGEELRDVLTAQGSLLGIVDCKIALKGSYLLADTVRETYQPGSDWAVSFALDSAGAKKFAEAVKGKAGKPLYLFLDRPKDAVLIISNETLKDYATANNLREEELMKIMKDALCLDSSPIDLIIYSGNISLTKNYTTFIIDEKLKGKVNVTGNVKYVSDIMPKVASSGFEIYVEEWPAINLLSAPILRESVTTGSPVPFASISGNVQGEGREKYEKARKEALKIVSILRGGSLPATVIVGAHEKVTPSLGRKFFELSVIALAIVLLFVSLFISLRYRNKKIIFPLIFFTLADLVVLLSFFSAFTLDLSTLAGIIASLGTGIDAKIIITDEYQRKEKEEAKKSSLKIVRINAIVAFFSILPLIFSGMVEIVGFAIATALSALIGYAYSRPLYVEVMDDIKEGKKFFHSLLSALKM